MSIWTFNRSILALMLGFGVSACEEGTSFDLASLIATDLGGASSKNHAVEKTELLGGAVLLQAPEGYCFDKRVRRQNFALLARCDTLGAEGDQPKVPLGIMTVSIAPQEEEADITALLPLLVPKGGDVVRAVSNGPFEAVLIEGGRTPRQTGPLYWKGLRPLDGYLVALSAYGPEGGAFSKQTGAEMLTRLGRGFSVPDPAN